MARSNRPPRRLAATVVALVVAFAMLANTSPASAHTPYVVEPGDTLSVIARDHGVTTRALAEANGITRYDFIRVGQVLQVPVDGPTSYTVAPGDTLSQIAVRHGVSSAALADLNGIDDPNRIRVGRELRLPAGATTSSPAGPSVANVPPAATAGAAYPSLPSRIRSNPERLALVPSFERWAAHYGIPTDLLMAVAYQESGWQAGVVSSKGAIGVGQILPVTADWIAEDLIGIPTLDPYDPDDNIRMSARFLLWLIGYMGSEDAALAGYYQGPGSVSLAGLYQVTQNYIANVQGIRWRFQTG